MAKRPRFFGSSWDPTPEEVALMRAAREQFVEAERTRATADALQQQALTVAAGVAQAQMDRCGSDSDYMLPVRSLAAELGAAVRESSVVVQHRMFDALVLTARFPATTLALQEARITARHAGIIREHGDRLPDGDVLATYERQAVVFAEDATPSQLRVFVKTLADRLAPESLTARHERAKTTRGAWMRDLEDGMAEIAVVHTATVVHGIHDRLTRMGKTVESVQRRTEREAREARDADASARRARKAEVEREEFRNAVTRITEHGHSGFRRLGGVPGGDADAVDRENDAAPPRRDAFGRLVADGDDSSRGVEVAGVGTDADAADRAGDVTPPRRDAFGCVITDEHDSVSVDDAREVDGDRPTGATMSRTAAGAAREAGTDATADTDTDAPLSRTLDEVRADLAADLLLSATPTAHVACDETGKNLLDGIRGSVQITIPVAIITGTGTDTGAPGIGAGPRSDEEDSGEAFLAGYGPIDPDTARRLAGTASGWDRLFRDPDTGVLLTIDRYTPSEQQKRFLLARDETCRFPCCRTPVRRADADHTIDWQHGGETHVANLATLCRAHHMVKHHTPWTVKQHPGGVLEWESPLGTTYIDKPQPTVRFTASTDTGPPGPTDPPPF